MVQLDSYIESMDETALKFAEILADNPTEYICNSFLKKLSHQFSFEVMIKNLIGDRSGNILERNGNFDIFKAISEISNGIYWRMNNTLTIIGLCIVPQFGLALGKFSVHP